MLQPLPEEWLEGKQLVIDSDWDAADDRTPEEIDASFEELARLCQDNDPADEELLMKAIEEQRQQSKAHMRRVMGLPE